ncbi:MAG: hypothetical protein MPW16_20515 (plasmid) [Candidatus Manganitrophus sp.]|nr:MAG: hypothetical protein MPW16_20515 [Candidatus Manganitrophus sp.]
MAWGPKKSDEEYQKEAILHYTNAIKADPKIKEAYLARAGMYWSSKKYTLAIKDHDKIIELDPVDGSAYHERGFVYNKIGEYWNAIQDFTQALKAKKKVPFVYQTYLNRGKAYDNIGQFNEAISDYTKAIELKIGDVLILMNLTQIRSIYPEYNSLDNKALLTSLHAKYFPNMELDDFSNSLLEEKRKLGDFLASEIFVNRGDTYLRFGRYAKGIDDYRRAEQIWEGYSHERWKYLFDSSKFRVYLDLDTVEKTIKNLYSFWLKYEYTKTKPKEVLYSIQNITIDCLSKKINTLSKVEYDADGNIISNYDVPSGWSTVIPDSLGETIYRGWCNDDSRIED